jgi:arylsulfatase A-like enzyme
MQSVPRESLSREAILRFELKKHQTGGGIDYSDELTTPNDLTALRNYYSQMSMVDAGVGQVLAALQAQGLDEDTLVIFTCDHGFSLGHHGFWGHGQATWPANTHRAAFHIPLLIRHLNHIGPLQASKLTLGSVDLFATVLDYVGLGEALDDENNPSRSFASLLRGEQLEWENEVFMEQEETRAIRTDQWRYMRRFGESQAYPFQDELYNLIDDPGEKQDLIHAAHTADIAAELKTRIDTFFSRYADPRFDLWQGGCARGNSDKPWLWQDAWGEAWRITY